MIKIFFAVALMSLVDNVFAETEYAYIEVLSLKKQGDKAVIIDENKNKFSSKFIKNNFNTIAESIAEQINSKKLTAEGLKITDQARLSLADYVIQQDINSDGIDDYLFLFEWFGTAEEPTLAHEFYNKKYLLAFLGNNNSDIQIAESFPLHAVYKMDSPLMVLKNAKKTAMVTLKYGQYFQKDGEGRCCQTGHREVYIYYVYNDGVFTKKPLELQVFQYSGVRKKVVNKIKEDKKITPNFIKSLEMDYGNNTLIIYDNCEALSKFNDEKLKIEYAKKEKEQRQLRKEGGHPLDNILRMASGDNAFNKHFEFEQECKAMLKRAKSLAKTVDGVKEVEVLD